MKGLKKMISTKMTINPKKIVSHINPELYGQFSEHLGRCIYNGIYSENEYNMNVVNALKELEVPVLRWPGGCFADEYHWRDGIGPVENRRRMVNSNWGGVVEDNSFGTHEFLNMCEMIGCKPYIAVNVGSGTVREAAEWIEYMNSDSDSTIAMERVKNGREKPWKVEYVGIGNENWGCGGSMEPEYYASEYKKFQQFCRDYNDTRLYKIACGPNATDYNWTKKLMAHINKWHAKAISLHYYTVPGDWEHKGSATVFDEKEYYTTIRKTLLIDEMINKHLDIMSEADPDHDIDLLVDEWGTWYDVEPGTNPGFLYQQNTMRDAIVAAINLNIFNSHSDRVKMANIAQVVNVLQAMLLTEGDKVVKTPTYDVFYMYKNHQNAELVKSDILNYTTGKDEEIVNALSQSASIKGDKLFITLSNADLGNEISVDVELVEGLLADENMEITVLTGDCHDFNSFDNPEKVKRSTYAKSANGNNFNVTLPPCSVVAISCHVK